MDSMAPFTMGSRNCMSLKWGLSVLLGHWLWEWAVTEWRWCNCWTEEVHGTSYSESDCVSWWGVKRQCDNCHLRTICATTNSHTITVHFVHYNNYAFVTVHAQWTMDDGHAKDATHSSTSVLTFWSTRTQYFVYIYLRILNDDFSEHEIMIKCVCTSNVMYVY